MDDQSAVQAIADAYSEASNTLSIIDCANVFLGIKGRAKNAFERASETLQRLSIFNERLAVVTVAIRDLRSNIGPSRLDEIDARIDQAIGFVDSLDVSVATACYRHLEILPVSIFPCDVADIRDESDAYYWRDRLASNLTGSRKCVEEWRAKKPLPYQVLFDRIKREIRILRPVALATEVDGHLNSTNSQQPLSGARDVTQLAIRAVVEGGLAGVLNVASKDPVEISANAIIAKIEQDRREAQTSQAHWALRLGRGKQTINAAMKLVRESQAYKDAMVDPVLSDTTKKNRTPRKA